MNLLTRSKDKDLDNAFGTNCRSSLTTDSTLILPAPRSSIIDTTSHDVIYWKVLEPKSQRKIAVRGSFREKHAFPSRRRNGFVNLEFLNPVCVHEDYLTASPIGKLDQSLWHCPIPEQVNHRRTQPAVSNMDRHDWDHPWPQRQSSLPSSLFPYLYSGPQDNVLPGLRPLGPLHPAFPFGSFIPPLGLPAALSTPPLHVLNPAPLFPQCYGNPIRRNLISHTSCLLEAGTNCEFKSTTLYPAVGFAYLQTFSTCKRTHFRCRTLQQR
jgi:hypothetical protein